MHWEFWPMWLVYLPISVYYIYLSFKAKSFFFFSAANPSIETGGMFFESKFSVLQLLPKAYYPTTVYIPTNAPIATVISQLANNNISFPIIIKPNRGERGWRVQKIDTQQALAAYLFTNRIDTIIQPFINYSYEFSVFYYRHPTSTTGSISSVTKKELLHVIGDGKSTLAELISKNRRAFLQSKTLQEQFQSDWNTVIPLNEHKLLVPYGNHARGATFIDVTAQYQYKALEVFDAIAKAIPEFYYGRFDVKCESEASLYTGVGLQIVELNGAGAEPAHIYDPNFKFFKAQQVLYQHYKIMYQIATYNHANSNIPFLSYRMFRQLRKQERQYKKVANG